MIGCRTTAATRSGARRPAASPNRLSWRRPPGTPIASFWRGRPAASSGRGFCFVFGTDRTGAGDAVFCCRSIQLQASAKPAAAMSISPALPLRSTSLAPGCAAASAEAKAAPSAEPARTMPDWVSTYDNSRPGPCRQRKIDIAPSTSAMSTLIAPRTRTLAGRRDRAPETHSPLLGAQKGAAMRVVASGDPRSESPFKTQ